MKLLFGIRFGKMDIQPNDDKTITFYKVGHDIFRRISIKINFLWRLHFRKIMNITRDEFHDMVKSYVNMMNNEEKGFKEEFIKSLSDIENI